MRKKHLAALLVWLAAAQAMLAMFGQRAALVSALYWCIVTVYWCRNI